MALVVVTLVVAPVGTVVAHDLFRWWAVDALSVGGYLCERDDGTVWRDPSMGCGYWEDPRCRYDQPCASSRIITEAIVETGAWVLWTERRVTGPDPVPAGVDVSRPVGVG